jgi:hypothetical protein
VRVSAPDDLRAFFHHDPLQIKLTRLLEEPLAFADDVVDKQQPITASRTSRSSRALHSVSVSSLKSGARTRHRFPRDAVPFSGQQR